MASFCQERPDPKIRISALQRHENVARMYLVSLCSTESSTAISCNDRFARRSPQIAISGRTTAQAAEIRRNPDVCQIATSTKTANPIASAAAQRSTLNSAIRVCPARAFVEKRAMLASPAAIHAIVFVRTIYLICTALSGYPVSTSEK